MPRALLIVTSQDRLGTEGRRTGFWLSDLTRFHRAATMAGVDCDLLSPRGGRAPVDERSLDLGDPANQAFLKRPVLAASIGCTLSPRGVLPGEYDLVFFVGGHGALVDFPADENLARIALEVHRRGGVIAASGHGVAALLGMKHADGSPFVEGKRVTSFTASEETLFLTRSHAPLLVEQELRGQGALYSFAEPFSPHIETSGRVITGQNPQSTDAVAEAALVSLRSARAS